MVAILSLAYLVSFVDRTILSLLIEPIKADLHITDTQIALLQGAAFGLFYTVMGIPLGWAVDRYSRKSIIGLGCSLWCVMTAACGLAGSFGQMFVARLGVGLGEATLSPGAASIIADLFPPKRRALAMSVYAMGGSLGVGLSLLAGGLVVGLVSSGGPLVIPLLGPVAPWQAVMIIVGLSGLVVAIAILSMPEPVRRGAAVSSQANARELIAFMKSEWGQLGNQFGGIALYGLVSYAVLGWIPAMFTRLHGWTAAEVGLRYGTVFLVCGGGGALAGGWLAGQLARRGVAKYNLRVAAIGVTALIPFGIAAPLVSNGWLALALLGPVAFCFAVPTGGSIAAIQQITPNRLRGQVASLYYLTIGLVGLLLGPLSVALLTDQLFRDPLRLGWSLAIVCGVVQPVAAWLMWRAVKQSHT
ncbi:MAG: MFS transporter [Sphingomonas sp.]|uniref:MFS transporter n=1 Tax=Sphingomonas sp. TaxID=28214 RepID=UPI0035A9680F|nr:MFS transporter [Sphingomonas sp.]